MELVDTHCHIHDPEFSEKMDKSPDEMISDAKQAGVTKLICVGTAERSSELAVDFSATRDSCWASLALHPHEVATYSDAELDEQMRTLEKLAASSIDKVVAIGETGLDYYYHDDPDTHKRQKRILKRHIELALSYDLPLIFHIRDPKTTNTTDLGTAFSDFLEVIAEYDQIRGVVHSFSAGIKALDACLDKGLYIGLNGIMTFTKDQNQLDAAKKVPKSRLLLETDSPFLTPKPFRGIMCEPKHERVTAEFLSDLRDDSLEELAKATTINANKLFGI
ncbi:MAG: TatD DNase family protein [Candidatus Saccharimonadales bacterium]|jgi:TatD DNase family protein